MALGLSNDEIQHNCIIAGHVCGDEVDLVNGKPSGAIRTSFGKESIWEDLDALLTFIERIFVSHKAAENVTRWDATQKRVVLSELYVFPIKSCAAQRVRRWELDRLGRGKLVVDREFALVDSSGTAMRLSIYPKMASITPVVDTETSTMTVSAPGQDSIMISLEDSTDGQPTGSIVKVCGKICGAKLWGDLTVSNWFSNYLGVRCWLARHDSKSGTFQLPQQVTSILPRSPSIAFCNEQPLLLISEHAVDTLNRVLGQQNQRTVCSRHFRPNMVVRTMGDEHQVLSGSTAQHTEDGWTTLTVVDKKLDFQVVGRCARCSMVDVDSSTGLKGRTLGALADYRRSNGQILFGIFLQGTKESYCDNLQQQTMWLEEGDILFCQ